MTNLVNNMQNNALTAIASRASGGVINAIEQASAKTGVNFAYLVQQAGAESSFDPEAKARTSSASGLYQFIERTWLNMVDNHGEKHGIETDGKSRSEILALRNDPETASLMAAEFASENEKFLEAHYDGDIGATELYFAHFMGASGGSAFLNARQENPLQEAAVLFPSAAKANRNVFYEQSTGRAKSLDEVYAFFDKKFSIKDAQSSDLNAGNTGSALNIANLPTPAIKPQQSADIPEFNFKTANTSLYNLLNSKDGSGGAHNSLYSPLEASTVRRTAANPLGMFQLSNPGHVTMLAELNPALSMPRAHGSDVNRAYLQPHTNSLYSGLRSYNR